MNKRAPVPVAREALLPAIVRHGDISAERLKGLQEGLGAVAMLVGPAVAGTLMTVFSGSTVLWITAATSSAESTRIGAACPLEREEKEGNSSVPTASTGTPSGSSVSSRPWRSRPWEEDVEEEEVELNAFPCSGNVGGGHGDGGAGFCCGSPAIRAAAPGAARGAGGRRACGATGAVPPSTAAGGVG